MQNPITKRRITTLLATLAVLLTACPLHASDATQRIPDNALGFVVVRDLGKTDGKVDQLLKQFNITFPAPLAFIKMVTGLESGLDLSGDLVVALMPGDGSNAPLVPMVLLPISDYTEFAQSISADPSGDVCRVAIVGEDVLVAQGGPYAMLMNVEHRQTLEALVGLKAEPIAQLEPIANWLQGNDISLVLMQPGIQQLGNWKPSSTNNRLHRLNVTNRPPLLPTSYLAKSFGPEILSWLRANIKLSAIGVTVDDQQNVRLSEQFIPLDSVRTAELTSELSRRSPAQPSFLSTPVVLSGGGPVSKVWGKQLAMYLQASEQQNVITNGLENVTPEQWEKNEQAYKFLFADIESCSVVMLPGEEGEPLLGNFLGTATVPSVETYFDQLSQVAETWNEITSQATNDIRLEYEIDSRTISGKQARELVVDVASAANDPNAPLTNWLFEALLGRDGKLRMQFVEIDSTTFAFGLATDGQLTRLIENREQTEPPTVPPNVDTTLGLLNQQAPWKVVVSPQGCAHWASRVVNEFLVHLGSQTVEAPNMPASPPLGISATLADGRWECELVCPAETLQALADYLETTAKP